MHTSEHVRIGLINVLFFCGTVAMLTLIGCQATKRTISAIGKAVQKEQIRTCDLPQIVDESMTTGRFIPAFGGSEEDPEAYCDKESGLVWEHKPSADNHFSWYGAKVHCDNRRVGGRVDWRVPSNVELMTLVDPKSALCKGGGPCLPDDNPFLNVRAAAYWTDSMLAFFPTDAWFVHFSNGTMGHFQKAFKLRAWCVRGAINVDSR